jgi:hypothetical protein
MQERVVDDAWIVHRPGMARLRHQPVSFVMVWQSAVESPEKEAM